MSRSDKQKISPGRRVAICGIMAALAMVFAYVEAMIPINFGVPGMKIGIANLVVVTGLYYMRASDVFIVSMIRIILSGFMFGSGMSIIYSLAGGILSFLVMLLLMKFAKLSITGVSIAGGVCHNLGQILVAAVVVESTKIFYYFPVLMISGLVTGAVIGLVSGRVVPIIKKNFSYQ